jgi:pSer/pThr/pTyr-binding forkhead associated (FHA) protein
MTSPSHPLADRAPVVEPSQEVPPVQPPLWTEEEQEDLQMAKHSTLTLDEDARESLEAAPLPGGTPKYVQGMVQGKQIYLVTNLINNQTQTLFQPQLVWTIGRNRSAAFPLHDRQLSRRHAVIVYTPFEGFCLVDLNSMNGSYVNGQRVQQRQRLQDGDWVCVGSTQFFFFKSAQEKKLDRLHPEVLMRLNKAAARSTPLADSPELDRAISFKTVRND